MIIKKHLTVKFKQKVSSRSSSVWSSNICKLLTGDTFYNIIFKKQTALSGLVHTYVGIFKAVFLCQLAFYPHAIRFFFIFVSPLRDPQCLMSGQLKKALKVKIILMLNIVLLKNSTILRSNLTPLSVHTRLPLLFCRCCSSFFEPKAENMPSLMRTRPLATLLFIKDI